LLAAFSTAALSRFTNIHRNQIETIRADVVGTNRRLAGRGGGRGGGGGGRRGGRCGGRCGGRRGGRRGGGCCGGRCLWFAPVLVTHTILIKFSVHID